MKRYEVLKKAVELYEQSIQFNQAGEHEKAREARRDLAILLDLNAKHNISMAYIAELYFESAV